MTPAREAAHHSERSHVARRTATAVAAIVAFLTVGAGVGASRSPFSQAAITPQLEDALHAKVAIRKYKETYLPPGCIAEGITITSPDSARKGYRDYQQTQDRGILSRLAGASCEAGDHLRSSDRLGAPA